MFYTWVLEAVFGFKEGGLKLDVTMWVPRFTQSVLMNNLSCYVFWVFELAELCQLAELLGCLVCEREPCRIGITSKYP